MHKYDDECGYAIDRESIDEMCLHATQRIIDNDMERSQDMKSIMNIRENSRNGRPRTRESNECKT